MSRQRSPTSELGRFIRTERRKAGLTQTELARKAGIAPNHLSRLESGEKIDPRFATVASLAAALGVSLHTLAIRPRRRGSTSNSASAGTAHLREVVRNLQLAVSAAERQLKRILNSLASPATTRWKSS
jgi:transcriptional regulator with XRE-family HTH domain